MTNVDTSTCSPKTISDTVVLLAAVIVSFHYCGANANVGKIGLAVRGAGAYTVCGLGRQYKKKIDGFMQFGRDKRRLKKNRKLIAKCGCNVLHSKREERRSKHDTMYCTQSK